MHFSISYFYEARFVLLQHPSPWTFPFRIHFSPLRFSLIKYLLILLSYPYSLPFLFYEKLSFYVRSNGFSSNEWKHISLNRLVSLPILSRKNHTFWRENLQVPGLRYIHCLAQTNHPARGSHTQKPTIDPFVNRRTIRFFFRLRCAYLSLFQMIIPQIRVNISLRSLPPLLRILLPRISSRGLNRKKRRKRQKRRGKNVKRADEAKIERLIRLSSDVSLHSYYPSSSFVLAWTVSSFSLLHPPPRPNLNKAIQTARKKKKKRKKRRGGKKGWNSSDGRSHAGIVRLAHMEGTKLSPRDNRESLSSLVIRGPTFPCARVGKSFLPLLPSPWTLSPLLPPRNGFIQVSPSFLLLLCHR